MQFPAQIKNENMSLTYNSDPSYTLRYAACHTLSLSFRTSEKCTL
jgi:hypothetical protein